MKNLFILLLVVAALVAKCTEQPAQTTTVPYGITDTIRLQPGEGAGKDLFNDLQRLRVRVDATNYSTDTARTIVVQVYEIGN